MAPGRSELSASRETSEAQTSWQLLDTKQTRDAETSTGDDLEDERREAMAADPERGWMGSAALR